MRAVTARVCYCDASPAFGAKENTEHSAVLHPSSLTQLAVLVVPVLAPGDVRGWNEFKLFQLNLCPPTKTDWLRSAKKLVPALRSNRSSAGENKWRSKSLVMFHFYSPLPRLSPTLFQKYHRARRCRKQCLISKRALKPPPRPTSFVSIARRQRPHDTAGLVAGYGGGGRLYRRSDVAPLAEKGTR